MKQALPVLCFLLGLESCFSFGQTPDSSKVGSKSPLDSYINVLRNRRLDSAAAEFGQICGVKLDEAAHRFAFSNDDAGTWRIVADLPKEYDNIGMDLVGTAEVWRNSKRTVLEEWEAALDVGGFGRTFYCFDSLGRLKALDATNYQIPDEGEPWGMHERWVLKADGTFRAVVPFQFVALDGKVIPQPKLNEDYKSFAGSWGHNPPSRTLTIQELKLPIGLFQ
jgi:hypothetical protein